MDIRADEDRAHQQIDQARLEAKALQQRLEREQREHDKRVTQLITQNEKLQVAMRTAEQAAAHQAGQVAALETTLSQWRGTLARTRRGKGKESVYTHRAGRLACVIAGRALLRIPLKQRMARSIRTISGTSAFCEHRLPCGAVTFHRRAAVA
jgi:septal ring factor EnvC (AmiA/AmiB activator)